MSKKGVLHPSSIILASGGGRGITAHCVTRLAGRAGCKFILLGRSLLEEDEPPWAKDCQDEGELKRRILQSLQAGGEKASPQQIQKAFAQIRAGREIRATLEAVRRAGGEAEYVSVDVADLPALRAKLQAPVQRLGAITGIIHGAGALADKLIEKKSEQDFETVYLPKIRGLENLLACAPPEQLDFLVLFSSIVGFFGNAGQSDYAIANEILNKSAYLIQRRHPNCRVLTINWGPWEAGMVTPELKKAFAAQGVEIIPLDVGAQMLADELAPVAAGAVQVVVGSPPARPARKTDAELRQYQIRRALKLEANPFLRDHKIGDNPVLPATCAATWAVNSCEQLYPGYTFFSIEDFKVLKGIVFDSSLSPEYTLDLKEISKEPERQVTFEALITSQGAKGPPRYHYSLKVGLARRIPPPPVMPLPDLGGGSAGRAISGQALYEDGTLFHGPSFQGVDQVVTLSPVSLVVRCILPRLPEDHQGQFPVQTGNPYLYDAIVQCLLIWSQQYYRTPCLPSYLQKLEQFKLIPFETPCTVAMEVRSFNESSVSADILVQDGAGEVYVRITGLEGTISKGLARLIGYESRRPSARG